MRTQSFQTGVGVVPIARQSVFQLAFDPLTMQPWELRMQAEFQTQAPVSGACRKLHGKSRGVGDPGHAHEADGHFDAADQPGCGIVQPRALFIHLSHEIGPSRTWRQHATAALRGTALQRGKGRTAGGIIELLEARPFGAGHTGRHRIAGAQNIDVIINAGGRRIFPPTLAIGPMECTGDRRRQRCRHDDDAPSASRGLVYEAPDGRDVLRFVLVDLVEDQIGGENAQRLEQKARTGRTGHTHEMVDGTDQNGRRREQPRLAAAGAGVFQDAIECVRQSPIRVTGKSAEPIGLAFRPFNRHTAGGALNPEPIRKGDQALRTIVPPFVINFFFELHGGLADQHGDVIRVEVQSTDIIIRRLGGERTQAECQCHAQIAPLRTSITESSAGKNRRRTARLAGAGASHQAREEATLTAFAQLPCCPRRYVLPGERLRSGLGMHDLDRHLVFPERRIAVAVPVEHVEAAENPLRDFEDVDIERVCRLAIAGVAQMAFDLFALFAQCRAEMVCEHQRSAQRHVEARHA